MNTLRYPAALIAVEKRIKVGNVNKRFDIVIYNRDHKPWMLVECKAPDVAISEKTLHQLLNYQRTAQCSYWLLTNGHQAFCADACDIQNIKWLTSALRRISSRKQLGLKNCTDVCSNTYFSRNKLLCTKRANFE
jgi:hypothetical protein